jgi:hypothetical protein
VATSQTPTRLELLARELGADPWELRWWLRQEIDRRRRERGEAWDALDRVIEMRETTASRAQLMPKTSGTGLAAPCGPAPPE